MNEQAVADLIGQHRRAYDSDCGEDYGCSCQPFDRDHYDYNQIADMVPDHDYARHLAGVIVAYLGGEGSA